MTTTRTQRATVNDDAAETRRSRPTRKDVARCDAQARRSQAIIMNVRTTHAMRNNVRRKHPGAMSRRQVPRPEEVLMLKFIHVAALIASLFDHHAHLDHVENELNIILGHINSRRAIVR